MSSEREPLLESLGLGVAQIKVSTVDPNVIETTYYGGPQADASGALVTKQEYRSEVPVSFPGRFKLPDVGLELSISQSSNYSFAISVSRDGAVLAQGLGLTDRDSPAVIMVAWWVGGTEPYGVVKYSIRDSTVAGYYISKMTPDAPGEDIAIGDTGSGFRGDYVLRSQELNGRTWGPHDWTLTSRGEITDLTWRENGRVFCRGIGMPDPQDNASIIATYIAL